MSTSSIKRVVACLDGSLQKNSSISTPILNQVVSGKRTLTSDHCTINVCTLSPNPFLHISHSNRSPSGPNALSIAPVDKSGRASHARYALANAHALVNFFC